MLGMQAADITLMREDQLDGIYGLQGCDVRLHWTEESGARDSYGRAATETAKELIVRAQLNPMLRRMMEEGTLENAKTHYRKLGDMSLTFDLCVGMQQPTTTGIPPLPSFGNYNATPLTFDDKPGLWIEVKDAAGNALLELAPEMKPPHGAGPRAGYYVANRRFVQEVFCRPRT